MENSNLVYGVKDKPSWGKIIVFALQQMLAILAATIAVPAIINNGVIVELLDLNKNPNKRLQLPRIFLNIFGVEQ